MKRLVVLLISIIFCLSASITAYASGEADTEPQPEAVIEETTRDASQPRLMVSSYTLEGESLSTDKSSVLKITFKNYSRKKALYNLKFTISDESGEIKFDGMGTKYVERISAGGSYTWEVSLIAAKTAQIGEHKLGVTAEYEDEYYDAYSSSDIISLNVKQSVGLDYDGIMLPTKVTQGDTFSMEVTLMNTGKSALRNCKLTFSIDGIESSGTLFIGEIPAGESKSGSANLRAALDKLGEVKGKITLSYEDAFGEQYSKDIEVSTTVNEKIEIVEEPEEEQAKYPLWWAFMLGGIAVGGGIGAAIPIAINSYKQRKEDEMRL